MANTYTQIHLHVVFAVKYRQCLIAEAWKLELYKYISGIIKGNGHKILAINGMPDHIHLFFGMRPVQAVSDFIRQVKGDSSEWVNKKDWVIGKFAWQEGFGCFSYSKSQVPQVIRYVHNQEEHHRKLSFLEEYKMLLEAFEVDFDEQYIFKLPE